jgi:short-subunit dehydrogenase
MAYALITGSAKGIGKSIAIELAQRGYHILLTDIDEPELQKTADEISRDHLVRVYYLVRNLQDPKAADELYDWSEPYHGSLEILVNNAGYGLTGYFEKLPLDQQLGIIDVNIKATVALTYKFIPVLKEKQRSYLMITGSTTAYQSVPYLSVYAASKAFILSFTI